MKKIPFTVEEMRAHRTDQAYSVVKYRPRPIVESIPFDLERLNWEAEPRMRSVSITQEDLLRLRQK